MFAGKYFILTILVSVFVSIQGNDEAKANNCRNNTHIDGNKLAGKWNYVAQVSMWSTKIRCGHMFLNNESEGRFCGYWVGTTATTFSNITVDAHLYNNTFELILGGSPRGIPMILTTCNSDTEFALEDRASNWYYIFSKTNEASREFLEKYQSIADEKNIILTIMNNDNCDDEEGGENEIEYIEEEDDEDEEEEKDKKIQHFRNKENNN